MEIDKVGEDQTDIDSKEGTDNKENKDNFKQIEDRPREGKLVSVSED